MVILNIGWCVMLKINLFLQSISSPFWDFIFITISNLITDIPLVITLCVIYWCINKEKGIKIGFILLNGMQFNFIIKDIFKVERPYVKNSKIINKDIEYGYGYSFPSNHSQISSSFLFSFARYFNISKVFIPSLILVLMICFSRVYLGVHSILDVSVGFILGITFVKVLGNIIDKIIESKKYYLAFLFLILGIIGMFVFKNEDSFKITSIYFGFLTGFLIENKYIDYKIPQKTKYKVINLIIGISGIALIYIFSPDILKYFLIGLWVTLPAPWLFKITERIIENDNRKNK
ncbi:MAG: phosphatase PAP2 family protein [Ruminococcaceae bacterium]|nr:phosphatase PAP2 family protein [Oscillospiraceae bacterium]